MENRIKKVMSEILGIDRNSISLDTSIGNVKTWDSLRHMNLVVALEEEFDILIDDEDVEIIVSYNNICTLIKQSL
jgi:acyl carrier protein